MKGDIGAKKEVRNSIGNKLLFLLCQKLKSDFPLKCTLGPNWIFGTKINFHNFSYFYDFLGAKIQTLYFFKHWKCLLLFRAILARKFKLSSKFRFLQEKYKKSFFDHFLFFIDSSIRCKAKKSSFFVRDWHAIN